MSGRRKVWSDQQILAALKALCDRQGRAPYDSELFGMKYGRPSSYLLQQRFGSVANALAMVEYQPNGRGGGHRSPGLARRIVVAEPLLDRLRRDTERLESLKLYWMTRGLVA